ncbi:DNA (cytosine-5)-methyltransferase DRM2-like isoform X2 [Silene latifolia]|uniref:DNA (cytosine-5)-methyltransferase DRM2-like isoform X2 n=1 Tax=Silene latifolia TaxID=37657 RepID=UPI003D76BBBA
MDLSVVLRAMSSINPDPTDDSSVESYEWDTDDELEMEFFQEIENYQDAVSSSSTSQNPAILNHFVAMGFNEELVIRALKENGEEDTEAILNSLLSYPVIENFPSEDPRPSRASFPYEEDSDCDSSCAEVEEMKDTLSHLIAMGYQYADAVKAVEQCGSDAPLDELTDFIFAAQTAETVTNAPTLPPQKRKPSFGSIERPRKLIQIIPSRDSINLNNMIGFGVPGYSTGVSKREIPKLAAGPPYFYYENVACTPKGVWDEISRCLYGIKPEFVDSLHFSAAARKRGYIHNLPIENRQPLLPIPPKTIHEALPYTKTWWPTWDKREKLNCLLTCIGSAPLTDRIRKRVESGSPSPSDIKYVMKQCKKWNLVWVGKHKVAILEPNDVEMLLGFPQDHTRGVGWTERYKALGNSFQIDTVGYHLSVLKPIYPRGMTVLSLFSGIGGAEVALHRLGIPLKAVVSVEISEVSRKIFQDWWDQTEQRGQLIHLDDVQKVDSRMIRRWITEFGGFDLVIGGSPCNNLAGGNRRTRDGLLGEHSSLFFQYSRILDTVMTLMKNR